MRDAECQMPDARYRIPDLGNEIRNTRFSSWHGNCGFIMEPLWVYLVSYKNLEIWQLSRSIIIEVQRMTLS
jgi:hypothetical protein